MDVMVFGVVLGVGFEFFGLRIMLMLLELFCKIDLDRIFKLVFFDLLIL